MNKAVGLLLAVVAGLIVAYVEHRFGWNNSPSRGTEDSTSHQTSRFSQQTAETKLGRPESLPSRLTRPASELSQRSTPSVIAARESVSASVAERRSESVPSAMNVQTTNSQGAASTPSAHLTTSAKPASADPDSLPESPRVQNALVMEGEVALLRSALEGRWDVPSMDKISPNSRIVNRLIVSLRVDTLPAIYGQPRTSVTLHWRKVEAGTARIVGYGAVERLVANGPDRPSATGRALRIALDTMLARIGRARLVEF